MSDPSFSDEPRLPAPANSTPTTVGRPAPLPTPGNGDPAEWFGALFEFAPDPCYLLDLEGRFLDANRAAEELMGYHRSEVVGESFLDVGVLRPEERAQALAGHQRNVMGERAEPTEYNLRRRDGTSVPVEIHSAPVEMGGRRVVLGVARDITRRKAAAEAQRRSHALLAALSRVQSLFIAEEDPHALFAELLQALLTVTGSDDGFVGEVAHDADGLPYLKTHAVTDLSWNEATQRLYEQTAAGGMEFRNLDTLFGAVLRTGQPVIANAPAADPRRGGLPPGHAPLASFLGIPFRAGADLVGMVGLANRAGGYDEELVAFVQPLTAACAQMIVAFRNARARREAEAASRESARRYEALFRNRHVVMLVLDPQTATIVDANPAACAFYGYDNAALVGMRIGQINTLSEAEILKEMQHARQNQRDHFHFRHRLASGEVRDVEVFSGPIDLDGRSLLYSIVHDVTERRRVEEELRYVLAHTRCLLWHATATEREDRPGHYRWEIAVFDEDAGQRFLPLDVRPGETYTDAWYRSRVPEDFREPDRVSSTALRTGAPGYEQEFRCFNRFGEVRRLYEQVHIEPIGPGKFRLAGVATDVTDYRQAEQMRDRLADIVQAMPQIVASLDPEWRVVTLNRSGREWLGLDPEDDLANVDVSAAFPDWAWKNLREVALPAVEREGVWEGDSALRRADGLEVPTRQVIVAHGRADRSVDFFSTMITDISERRLLEDELRQAQKMESVGRLAGGVAHDFNNMLVPIVTYSQMLSDDLDPGTQAHHFAVEIARAAERAANLPRQLLAFSRRQIIRPRVLDLDQSVESLERMLRRLIGEDVLLTVIRHPGLGSVNADPGQIEQILMNLAVNARDAMPAGGQLIIETANDELDETYARTRPGVAPGRYVVLCVSDTGCGMERETADRIFEPFFTTKEVGKGTGLGLATVHGIVKQSGGEIHVYTEPGMGTTFRIYFPRVDEDERDAQPAKEPAPAARGSETVLLVEDEAIVREVARMILDGAGYAVLVAGSGEEALVAAGRHTGRIHLLLTDVVMPGISGRQLADRLAATRPDTRVLFMSGYTEDAIVRHGVISESIAFIQKPFPPAVLLRRVREVLDATGG